MGRMPGNERSLFSLADSRTLSMVASELAAQTRILDECRRLLSELMISNQTTNYMLAHIGMTHALVTS